MQGEIFAQYENIAQFIQVHPDKNMFAVAEKGHAPDINIFSYPDMKCIHVLRGGTERSYAFIDYK